MSERENHLELLSETAKLFKRIGRPEKPVETTIDPETGFNCYRFSSDDKKSDYQEILDLTELTGVHPVAIRRALIDGSLPAKALDMSDESVLVGDEIPFKLLGTRQSVESLFITQP